MTAQAQTTQLGKKLGTFSLVMITVTCVDSVRNLPSTALFGSSIILFFALAGCLFFIPAALICAELSATWPEEGGVYLWGKKAFGETYGLFCVWFQWIENVIWYPTALSFIAGTLTYLITPQLADNKLYVFTLLNVVFWTCTWINLRGIELSARVTEILGLLGLIVPMTLIILLGAIWLGSDSPRYISFTREAIFKGVSDQNHWSALSAVILSLSGIEITTAHAADVRNPQKTYPRALIISTCFILSTLVMGALSIALVIPSDQLSLLAGIMEAFSRFFDSYHLSWLTPIMAICLVLGAIAGLNNWIIGPTRGLSIAGKDGFMPSKLAAVNRRNIPQNLLITQALIVSGLSCLFLYLPQVNQSYWLLNVLAAALYMLMYLIVFIAFIRLRLKYPDTPRPFQVPGGRVGMWLFALAGIGAILFTLAICFIPPKDLYAGHEMAYYVIFSLGVLLFSSPPLWLRYYRKRYQS